MHWSSVWSFNAYVCQATLIRLGPWFSRTHSLSAPGRPGEWGKHWIVSVLSSMKRKRGLGCRVVTWVSFPQLPLPCHLSETPNSEGVQPLVRARQWGPHWKGELKVRAPWSRPVTLASDFVVVQLDSVTRWAVAHQACRSFTLSWTLLNLMSIESVMLSNHLILFSSCLQSFPASGSFPVSQFFTSGGQRIGVSASASVLPMNSQDWSPLGWTGWISLQSKGLSRVFSNTTVQKHQFFGAQLYSPTLTSKMTTGKTIALTRRTFVSKVISLLIFLFLFFLNINLFILSGG